MIELEKLATLWAFATWLTDPYWRETAFIYGQPAANERLWEFICAHDQPGPHTQNRFDHPGLSAEAAGHDDREYYALLLLLDDWGADASVRADAKAAWDAYLFHSRVVVW
jgi:hypothetical protein